MTEKNSQENNDNGHFLPTDIYRLRVISGLGISVVAALILGWIVAISQSISGDNIVTLFALLVTLLTFVFLSISEPKAKRSGLNPGDIFIKIVTSLTLGVLANFIFEFLKSLRG